MFGLGFILEKAKLVNQVQILIEGFCSVSINPFSSSHEGNRPSPALVGSWSRKEEKPDFRASATAKYWGCL